MIVSGSGLMMSLTLIYCLNKWYKSMMIIIIMQTRLMYGNFDQQKKYREPVAEER